MTDHSTAKSVVNLVRRAIERVQFSAGLATLLEFTLKATEDVVLLSDVVESKTTLAGRAHATTHATHVNKPLRLFWRLVGTVEAIVHYKCNV